MDTRAWSNRSSQALAFQNHGLNTSLGNLDSVVLPTMVELYTTVVVEVQQPFVSRWHHSIVNISSSAVRTASSTRTTIVVVWYTDSTVLEYSYTDSAVQQHSSSSSVEVSDADIIV